MKAKASQIKYATTKTNHIAFGYNQQYIIKNEKDHQNFNCIEAARVANNLFTFKLHKSPWINLQNIH